MLIVPPAEPDLRTLNKARCDLITTRPSTGYGLINPTSNNKIIFIYFNKLNIFYYSFHMQKYSCHLKEISM